MKDELACTSVTEAVERDLKNITKEFNNVVLPFIKKHKDVFRSVDYLMNIQQCGPMFH